MAKDSSSGGTALPQWSSRFAFIMAAIGSAVGLGNIWKFPYLTGENGGAAFVLVYLACICVVGLPILAAELILGRMGRRGPVGTMTELGRVFAGTPAWGAVGIMGVIAAVLILSYYSVIAGWAVAYIPKLALGTFTGTTAEQSAAAFGSFLSDPWTLLFWHTAFMGATVFIVARGVIAGIEKSVSWMMPALFLMLLAMVGYAMVEGDFQGGVAYMFQLDFAKVTPDVVLAAIGQAFFSLSIGLGGMMAYGAYLSNDVSVPRTSLVVAVAGTLVGILAGLAIFPILLANGLEPAQGPGLVFVTLPLTFGNMPLGSVFGTIFFVLLFLAAITSAVALLEPVVASLLGTRAHGHRSRAVLASVVGGGIWALGIVTVLSFNLWSEVKPIGGLNLFEILDYLTSNIMLPLGGALIALFAGWVVTREIRMGEFGLHDGIVYRVWVAFIRVIAPAAVAVTAAQLVLG